jgi:hypothetical protein
MYYAISHQTGCFFDNIYTLVYPCDHVTLKLMFVFLLLVSGTIKQEASEGLVVLQNWQKCNSQLCYKTLPANTSFFTMQKVYKICTHLMKIHPLC